MDRVSLRTEISPFSVDHRRIAAIRLTLASSALLVTYFNPLGSNDYVALTYTILSLYVIYSTAFYLCQRYGLLSPQFLTWAHWVDVGWYAVLIALSSGTSSLFFFGFFFAILAASFQFGFTSGLRVTVISTLIYTIISLTVRLGGERFELNRYLLRAIPLLALGYLIAYQGGSEITLKQRLALLKEVGKLSNPRFGIDRTISLILERLRAFYKADSCLFIMISLGETQPRLFHACSHHQEEQTLSPIVHHEPASLLSAVPAAQAIIYYNQSRPWWRSEAKCLAHDVVKDVHSTITMKAGELLAVMLQARSLITVPMRYHGELAGRLYLTSEEGNFQYADIDFLLQVNRQVMPIVDNIRLVDRLASEAAEQERQRIARDIHDSIIQPYIGFQIGLTAVRQKLATNADVAPDLERLAEMAKQGTDDLRRYISGLKETSDYGGALLPALERFTAKFTTSTGIAARVKAETSIHLSDRLAAEAFQIVVEGLSNIRRHTEAKRAEICLACRHDQLILRIENEGLPSPMPLSFTPRSITERVAALGGRVRVEPREQGGTAVVVEIPL